MSHSLLLLQPHLWTWLQFILFVCFFFLSTCRWWKYHPMIIESSGKGPLVSEIFSQFCIPISRFCSIITLLHIQTYINFFMFTLCPPVKTGRSMIDSSKYYSAQQFWLLLLCRKRQSDTLLRVVANSCFVVADGNQTQSRSCWIHPKLTQFPKVNYLKLQIVLLLFSICNL